MKFSISCNTNPSMPPPLGFFFCRFISLGSHLCAAKKTFNLHKQFSIDKGMKTDEEKFIDFASDYIFIVCLPADYEIVFQDEGIKSLVGRRRMQNG
jgi:hypothetical protein